MSDYWQKQTKDKPLFPDLLWSRPENKQNARKLLIIGGNLHGFAAPAEAYSEALKAGVGTARVLMPDGTKKIVGRILENVEFAPSTPSGSFNQKALIEWLELSSWADGVLIAGDLGRNSETTIVLEKFLSKYKGTLTLTKDSLDNGQIAKQTTERPKSLIVLNIAQLQKLFIATKQTTAITFGIDLLKLVQLLHIFTEQHPAAIVTKHLGQFIVACSGRVSTTPVVSASGATTGQAPTDIKEDEMWRIKIATHATVWWLQNPVKPFAGITTSILL